jgi:hypothetical protein
VSGVFAGRISTVARGGSQSTAVGHFIVNTPSPVGRFDTSVPFKDQEQQFRSANFCFRITSGTFPTHDAPKEKYALLPNVKTVCQSDRGTKTNGDDYNLLDDNHPYTSDYRDIGSSTSRSPGMLTVAER